MSESTEQKEGGPALWSMGLKGLAGLIANCTAIGLICLMFYQDRHTTVEQSKEDRQMFREVLKEQRDVMRGHRNALEKITHSVDNLAEEVRRIREKK